MPEVPTSTPLVHDPVMAYEDGIYHLYSTGRGIQHATSVDMNEWEISRKPLMQNFPEWIYDSVPRFRDHVWAPDIIRYKDRWWIAYSCSSFGKNTSAIGLISSTDLSDASEWQDQGPLVCSRQGRDKWNAIDPNLIIDHKGNPWLSFGSFWDGIRLVRLDSTMHVAAGAEQRTIARHRLGHDNAIEAPFIFRHEDYYYLFVSWDYCCRGAESTYKVVVGRSKDIEGPYLDKEGTDMAQGGGTLVIEGDKQEFNAAGHCAVYHFNNQDRFICHGYSIRYGDASILINKPITWTDQGWPTL